MDCQPDWFSTDITGHLRTIFTGKNYQGFLYVEISNDLVIVAVQSIVQPGCCYKTFIHWLLVFLVFCGTAVGMCVICIRKVTSFMLNDKFIHSLLSFSSFS